MDQFLKKHSDKYDKWFKEDGIDYSSKIIPVSESLETKQWILPVHKAISILREAKSFAIAHCVCRTHYKCDKPKEVCFLLNEVGEKAIAKGHGRKVNFEEAKEILKIADKEGLVHLSLYQPNREIFALCNCCECCCHDLQLLKKHGRKNLIVHSDFIAETEEELCTRCGICIERCVFDARFFKNDILNFKPKLCYGCGLCVTACPERAISMGKLTSRDNL